MIVEINSARTVSAPNVTATGTQETPSTVFAQEDKWQMDKKLKARYGFGVDALEYRGGKIIGKTPEAQAVIDSDEGQFMKMSGYAFINLSKKYTGTPEFPDPVFVYENGKFQTTYQIFDEPCEGATNSADIIANVQRQLAEREKFFENGREGVLKGHSSGTRVAKKNSLFLPCGFDIRAILNGSDVEAIDQVFKSYDVLLSQKARTVGLAKIERYLKTDSIDDG